METLLSALSGAVTFFENYGGLIAWLLLALPYLLLLLILMPVYMVKGFKKGTFHGLVSLGCSLLAFGISIPLAKLIASLVSLICFRWIEGLLENAVLSVLPQFEGVLSSTLYISSYLEGIFSAILATVLFVVLAFILLIVLKVVVCKLLNGVLTKENPGGLFRTGGLLIRGVDALLVSFLFLVPFYCLLGSSAALGQQASSAFAENIEASTDQTEATEDASFLSSAIDTICSPVSNCPLVKASMLPGFNFPQRVFCSFKCEGNSYNLYDILSDGSELVFDGMGLLEKKPAEYGDTEVDLIYGLVETAENNEFFYGVFLDGIRVSDRILGAMTSDEDDSLTKMVTLVVEPFRDCTIHDVKESASALAAIFESAVENGILSGFGEDGDLFGKAAEGTFIDDAVTNLRSNDLLSSAADNVLLLMMDTLATGLDAANTPALSDAFSELKTSVEKRIEQGAPDPQKEISALKQIAGGMSSMNGGTKEGIEGIDPSGISRLFVGLGMHPHIGSDAAGKLLRDLLPTFVPTDEASILTDDFINSAVNALVSDIEHPATDSKQGKFENLLHTAKNLTVAVSKGTGAEQDRQALNDTIDSLLTDMTHESAEIISSAITKDVVDSINKNGQSSGNTEGFVKELIGNMADYDAQSDEDVIREREAVIKMNDLVLDAENKLQNKPDDGTTALETAVGGDLKGFVDEVSSSVVLMQTVSGSFERNPDKESDPDGFFANLGEDDKSKLNEVCGEMLLDDGVSADQKENIKLLCAFMGGSLN